MQEKLPVEICYYSSDFYAPYTGISMYSLCRSNEGVPFRIGCIDTGISEENKEKMRRMAEAFEREIVFHDFTELETYIRDTLQLPLCNGSYATYIKVFPDRIFQNTDRILFMDGDTIINGSIRPLLEMELEGYVFAAARVALISEAWIYRENRPDNLRLRYALKFQKDGYYNIGVFYANLRRWAEVNFGSQIMEMRKRHLDTITQASDVPIDEMLINLAVLERCEEHYAVPFSPQYNSTVHQIPHFRGLRANMLCGYLDKDDFNRAWYHPVIIHYCIFKPWYVDTFSPYRKVLDYYKSNSPWPDAFTEYHYRNKPERFFGAFVYRIPSERLMRFAIRAGHCFLRWRARFQNRVSKWKRFWLRLCGRNNIPEEELPPAKRTLPHWVLAVIRRCKCLLAGDLKAAFALPERWKH